MHSLSSITTSTQICAVIGNPVGHSLSPALHNAAFEATGLDFVYVASPVTDVKNALAGVRALGNFRGLSVTIPHKMAAIEYVDELNDDDRLIGSINTVIHEGNKLIGLGTDGPGALKAFADAGVEIDGKRVMMLGSGGAARAIAFTLARKNALQELELLDVNVSMLQELTDDLLAGTVATISASTLTEHALATAVERADIIIHCTPIGMSPNVNASLIPADLFRPEQVVFDIVYTPLETQLLADAKSRGCTVIPGVEMFLNQAVLQFQRFTGVEAPVEVMRKVVLERLQS